MQIWLIAAPPAVKFATIACGDRLREGRHALRDDAVIAGEDGDQRVVDMRLRRPLPAGEEGRNLLEPSERAGRLGELRLPLPRRRDRRLVRPRHLAEEGADVVEGKGGHTCLARLSREPL